MKKFDRLAMRFFLCGLPIALLAAFADNAGYFSGLKPPSYFELSGVLVLVAWMATAIYISLKLLFSHPFRLEALTRLTFLRERDEREVLLTGRATRQSFLLTLAILIVLLTLSLLKISVYRIPEAKSAGGNTGTITLGLNTNFWQEPARPQEDIAVSYFNYPGLPVSNSCIFLLLIVWQIASYNYFVSRLESGKQALDA